MPEPNTPPTGGEIATGPAPDNAAFARMRTELAAAQAATKDLQEKLTTMDRARMDELDRTKAELADAGKKTEALQAQASRATEYEASFKALYDGEIAALPAEKQARAGRLSAHGSYPERLEALKEYKAELGTGPLTAGTVTAPGQSAPPASIPGQAPPPGIKPIEGKDLGKLSFDSALKSRPSASETVIPAAQVDALLKRIEATVEQRVQAALAHK